MCSIIPRASLLDHFLDIGSGGKGLLTPGDHQDINAIVGVECMQGIHQLPQQGLAEGVHGLRAVQSHQPDGSSLFGENMSVVHPVLLP